MAAPTKTIGTSLFTHQAVTNPAVVESTEIDVSTTIWCTIFLYHAFIEATANTNPQTWLIQVSDQTSGDEDWLTIQEIPISETGTPADETLDNNESAAATVIELTLTAGFVSRDEVYFHHVTLGSGEWALIASIVTDTSITLVDGLTNAQPTTSVVRGSAQKDMVTLNLTTHNRLRVLYFNDGGTASNTHIKATLTTWDTFE